MTLLRVWVRAAIMNLPQKEFEIQSIIIQYSSSRYFKYYIQPMTYHPINCNNLRNRRSPQMNSLYFPRGVNFSKINIQSFDFATNICSADSAHNSKFIKPRTHLSALHRPQEHTHTAHEPRHQRRSPNCGATLQSLNRNFRVARRARKCLYTQVLLGV